jgi:hypothetical protein
LTVCRYNNVGDFVGKKEKLIKRFLGKPKDFTYAELVTLLTYFSYREDSAGKTSGSAVRFIHEKTSHIIRIHKPHPDPELKPYVLRLVIGELRKEGHIK